MYQYQICEIQLEPDVATDIRQCIERELEAECGGCCTALHAADDHRGV